MKKQVNKQKKKKLKQQEQKALGWGNIPNLQLRDYTRIYPPYWCKEKSPNLCSKLNFTMSKLKKLATWERPSPVYHSEQFGTVCRLPDRTKHVCP